MNTKTPLALAIATLVLLATTACNRNDDADGGTTNTPAATADAGADATATAPTGPDVIPGTDSAAPTQAEALALINVVNDHEVKAAEMAKSKNVTGPALEYANMMQAEHTANMTKTTELLGTQGGAPADTARVTDQRAKGEAKRTQLEGLTGEAFAKAYLDQMVMDHQETLTLLDSLMPAATDEAVRAHMTATRASVQKHLDHAKHLQGGATGTMPATGTAPAGGTASAGGTGQG